MERKPITKQRSQWTQLPSEPDAAWEQGLRAHGAEVVGIWERRVGDGGLRAIVTRNRGKWHMSISFHDHRGKLTRYPRWDEIADARYALCPDEITMAMLLPASSEYVAVHDTTFHLHEVDPASFIGGA